MKLERLLRTEAEHIIVYGTDKGFSMVSIMDIPLTIYHREYEGKHYDIAEMNTDVEKEDGEDETITTFYKLDPDEVLQILNLDKDYFKKG